MKKITANLKIHLLILVIASFSVIMTNMHIFLVGLSGILFGMFLVIASVISLIIFLKIEEKTIMCLNVASIVGPLYTFIFLLESFSGVRNIFVNFRIFGWAFLIVGILVLIDSLKIRKSIKQNPNLINEVNINKSPVLEVDRTIANNEYNNDTVVVDGYILGCVKNEDSTYSVEIEYIINNDAYVFYVGKFERDVMDIVNSKNIKQIPVFLEHGSPEFARIDEKGFMDIIGNL